MRQSGIAGGKTLPEQTADNIREYIKENQLKAGAKLPNEFQLAQLYGVGRSTVREAIKLLVFEGLVEVVRGNGTYLLEQKPKEPDDPMGLRNASNSAKKALEFLEVRFLLEPEVASLAASNANYEDCRRLRERKEAVERRIWEDADHIEEDVQFHIEIARCARNDVLYRLMEIVVTGIPFFVKVTNNSTAEETIRYHSEITEAICRGDSAGARYAMIEHLNQNRGIILNAVKENG